MQIEIFDSLYGRRVHLKAEPMVPDDDDDEPMPARAEMRETLAVCALRFASATPFEPPEIEQEFAQALATVLLDLYGRGGYYIVAALNPARASVFRAGSMEPLEVCYLGGPDQG